MKLHIKEHRLFFVLFIVIFIVYLSSFFIQHDIWWDSAVFLGMGKFLYSSGNVGLWESSRPVVQPIMLGFFWKLGFDAFLLGKIMVILSSLGIIFLTYLIAINLFNKEIAFIASLLLSLSSTFFMFVNILHTEIPSTFFALLGFYFFIKKKYNFSGLFLGIAFMTRFFQIFAFFPLILLLFYLVVRKKESYKVLFYFSLFFLIPVVPYLILNYIHYGNPFYPFLLQAFMTKNTGWIFYQPFYFYFINLVKENILSLFSLLGLVFVFKKPNFKKISIAIVFLFVFVPYNFVAHKEMRLLIPALPFLYILTSYGIIYFVDLFKKKKLSILALLLIIFLLFNVTKLEFNKYEDGLDSFYNYIDNEKINDGLWISNPAFISFSNLRSDELIYYPLFNSGKIDKLIDKMGNAKHILINTCDLLPCPPDDNLCNQKSDDFLALLGERFDLVLSENYGRCKHYIFASGQI